MTFSEGNKLFSGDPHVVLKEINGDMLQFTKYGTGNGLSNIRDNFLVTNASFTPKYIYLQGWSLKFK